MRNPVSHLYGNLVFTRDGMVWGVWRIEPIQFRNTAEQTRTDVLESTERFVKSLPAGEAMLFSLCPQTDPRVVYERMLAGVDPARHPEWVISCRSSAETLAGYVLSERTHWLALPIRYGNERGQGVTGILTAAASGVSEAFSVPGVPLSESRVAGYLAAAAKTQRSISGLRVRPAQPGEILWMYRRAPLRGLDEPPLEQGGVGGSSLRSGRLTGPSLAALDEVLLDEGGKAGSRLVSPFARRYVAASHPDRPGERSFQAFLCLAEMPEVFVFPGCAYLEQIDDLGFPLDWAVRMRIVPRDKAEAATRRRSRELAEQRNQRSDDTSGPPEEVERAAADLEDYRSRLTASASEVEVQVAVTFCVWADDPTHTDEYAETIRHEMAPADYQVVRPVGAQTALYQAMLPGAPSPRVLGEFTQYMFARDLAMAIPVSGTDLGDPTGGLLGLRVDSAGVAPVLHDPAYAPRQLHSSASTGLIGELGAGKSATMKVILDTIVRRGGRGLVIDRTPSGEWARFARVLPGDTRMLTITPDTRFSLDPLRCFPAAEAERYAEGFLALLLAIEPLSIESALLSEAIAAVQDPGAAEGQAASASMPAVMEVLAARADRRSHDLARRLVAASRLDLAATVFAADRPALLDPTTGVVDPDPLASGETVDLPAGTNGDQGGAGTLVFATHGIALPDRDEVGSEVGMRLLAPEKRLGRALMYLIAAICRTRAFSSPGFVGVFLDECYWLTGSVEGAKLALELVRDGRKHNAAVYLGGHDPADLGGEVISGLLGHKFLFRHRDKAMADRGLEWLGLTVDDDLRTLVSRDLSPVDLPDEQAAERAGECLFRDARGRTALMKVVLPGLPGVADAIRTDPHGPGS